MIPANHSEKSSEKSSDKSSEKSSSRVRQLLWFVGLWLLGVLAMGTIAGAFRFFAQFAYQ